MKKREREREKKKKKTWRKNWIQLKVVALYIALERHEFKNLTLTQENQKTSDTPRHIRGNAQSAKQYSIDKCCTEILCDLIRFSSFLSRSVQWKRFELNKEKSKKKKYK